ncbi:hypothetical protein ACGFY3_29430 [Streptomyces mirabilis]|uniref:hypothetical protein n=1 Tax=Streptomyces mirabilis TaxID=68239 RepID=UPI003710F1A4
MKNDRLNHADFLGAFALRHLLNRVIGQPHHCLQHGHRYDEAPAREGPSGFLVRGGVA